MEVVNVMPDGQFVNLQETFEEVDEDDERVIEEDILISNKEIERENVLHVTKEDDEENQADIDMSDGDFGFLGNANDY